MYLEIVVKDCPAHVIGSNSINIQHCRIDDYKQCAYSMKVFSGFTFNR